MSQYRSVFCDSGRKGWREENKGRSQVLQLRDDSDVKVFFSDFRGLKLHSCNFVEN